MRDFRGNLDALGRIMVPTDGQRETPISELATLEIRSGPAMIRDDNGLLTGYVYVDIMDRDAGSYIAEASRALHEKLTLPAGYVISWSGQYEAMQCASRRLQIVIPVTVGLVSLLVYLITS